VGIIDLKFAFKIPIYDKGGQGKVEKAIQKRR
jgi:hypothetical protein